MGQAETYLYAEFRGRFKKLDYTLGLGVTRSFFRQEVNDGAIGIMPSIPGLNLHYKLTDRSFIRLRGSLENTSPSLSNLNAVDLAVDSLQIQRGNPDLTPYLRYKADLTYEYGKGLFYGNLRGAYEYAPNAIMDEKFWKVIELSRLGTISGVGNASQVMPLYGSGRSRISCRYVWKAV